MSALKALVVSFNHISIQELNENSEQSIIVPIHYDINQSVISSISDDNKLLTPCTNKQLIQINYKIHHGFTTDEEIFIKNALEIVANRLFKPEILQNMYKICGTSGEFLEAKVWSRSQLKNNKNYHGLHDLLRFQLMCLKIKGENGEFPPIHIYPIYEKSDTQSTGTIGSISCIYHESTFSIEGKFEIKLNRYNLDISNKNAGNIVYWAGTIVHEMLHNLGHKHKINDYSNQWQINVFENCFIYNGNYLS